MKIKSLLLLPFLSLLLSGCDLDFLSISDPKSGTENVSGDSTRNEEGSTEGSEESSQEGTSEESQGQEGTQQQTQEDPQEQQGQEEETTTSYKVTFNPGRGSGSMDPVEVEEGYYYKLPKCTFTPPLGESFVCWGDEDGYTYKVGKEVRIYEDTTFTAYYASNGNDVFTVSFDSNGGSGTMSPVEVEEGLYELPTCTFTAPSGKVFDYWSIPSSSTKYQPENYINVTGNVTVSANWKNAVAQTYSITYVSNGGSGSMSKTTGEEGEWVYLAYCSFTAPSGKEFDYWSVDGVAKEEHTAIQLTKDFTATAIWKNKVQEEEEEEDVTLVNLDCGYKNVGIPENKDNPVEVRTTLSADTSSWFNTDFDEYGCGDYRYINGNNVQTNPSTYSSGYLKIDGKGKGFGSPFFTHTGAKLEIRIGIGEIHGTNTTCKDKTKDAFRIYFFGSTNNLLGQINISGNDIKNINEGQEIQRYYKESNAAQVKYFEVRCNEQPFNSSGKYMNLGISYCNVKSWEKA